MFIYSHIVLISTLLLNLKAHSTNDNVRYGLSSNKPGISESRGDTDHEIHKGYTIPSRDTSNITRTSHQSVDSSSEGAHAIDNIKSNIDNRTGTQLAVLQYGTEQFNNGTQARNSTYTGCQPTVSPKKATGVECEPLNNRLSSTEDSINVTSPQISIKTTPASIYGLEESVYKELEHIFKMSNREITFYLNRVHIYLNRNTGHLLKTARKWVESMVTQIHGGYTGLKVILKYIEAKHLDQTLEYLHLLARDMARNAPESDYTDIENYITTLNTENDLLTLNFYNRIMEVLSKEKALYHRKKI